MARRVFFEDTKVNCGWFEMAKQQGEDGSEKSFHPESVARSCTFKSPGAKGPNKKRTSSLYRGNSTSTLSNAGNNRFHRKYY